MTEQKSVQLRFLSLTFFLLLFSFTTASSRTSSSFKHLHKVCFDNVTAYMQKKQQRLEEQQLKRTKTQKANSTKKARTETQPSA